MMQVLLDGQPIQAARPTISGALDAGRSAAEGKGRVVIEVKLDGVLLSDEELADPGETERPGGVVELVSADPAALVSRTFEELGPLLESAKERQTSAANLISAGHVKDGLASLGEAFEVWNGVQRAVGDGLALLGLSAGEVRVAPEDGGPDAPLSESVDELAKHLGEIKRTLEAQDLPGLCDVLLYDLGEQADRWSAVLSALAAKIRSAGAR